MPNILNNKDLTTIWKKEGNKAYTRYSDCVDLYYEMARIIAKKMGKKPAPRRPYKLFKTAETKKNDKEGTDARSRYINNYTDRQNGEIITVYSGDGKSRKGEERFEIKPGMGIYTAQGLYYGVWTRRHMRMYIGNGEYRDIHNGHRISTHDWWPKVNPSKLIVGSLRPIKWAKEPNYPIFVVISVHDPFSHIRGYEGLLLDSPLTSRLDFLDGWKTPGFNQRFDYGRPIQGSWSKRARERYDR